MPKVVVAIDFGTCGTTFAYAFNDAKDTIIYADWNLPKSKNSTEIILDEYNETKVFGIDCEKYLSKESSLKEKFFHFKDIKMNLYNDILMIQSTNKEQMTPINIIITKCLKYIKKKAIQDIKARRPIIKENDIKWILTVPAIWKDKCKDIMIKAAKKAKILNRSNVELFLALEPEAAAYEYFNNPASDKNLISINNPYIICDLGGGTVDITTHQRINENGKIIIEELYPPIGGYNGSTLINKEFKKRILKKIFGKAYDRLMNCIQKPNENGLLYSDWCDLEDQIENFKIQLSLENVKNKETERINCTIFKEFIEKNFSITQLINNYNNNCPNEWKIQKIVQFKIYFPYKIIYDLTKELMIDKVIKSINMISKEVTNIQTIIYAGSVSKNDTIREMIKKEFPNIKNHICSTFPSIAVVSGAVYFGFEPFLIYYRRAKYTIGIDCDDIWNERYNDRPEKKYWDSKEKEYFCKECFHKYIEINEKIAVNSIITKIFKMPDPKCHIILYKTNKIDAKYIDEKDEKGNNILSKFGEIFFDIGDSFDPNNREIKIELKIGGTFITAKATHIYSSKEVLNIFEFL